MKILKEKCYMMIILVKEILDIKSNKTYFKSSKVSMIIAAALIKAIN